ncbi:BCCT family transporter [Fulvimarina sp. MAC8]|uniref:BCCT family transporter n=1 Tax=Fulvimarina sp. MAC8 TaxID=3162874 RepID=UPI0032ECECE2
MLQTLRQPVFIASAVIIVTLVILGASFPDLFKANAQGALDWTVRSFGWFYLISVFGFVLILFYLALSKYGSIKLGPPDSQPEFTFFSWVAMLLAAGFGVGLVFYGMAEPMKHFVTPPYGLAESRSTAAAELAIQYSFFDWGVHQWSTFAIVGLIIGYHQFRRNEPGLVSTVLKEPVSKLPGAKRIGNAVDVFAVVATVMGVATSVGLGVLQMNGGLEILYGIPKNTFVEFSILAVLAACYLLSVSSGLDKGIKILSNINLALAGLLMLFVFIVGPTRVIAETIVAGFGDYLQNFFVMSLKATPFDGSTWANDWTIFYWAWVIAWSPFVGTFVARISYGRTIREYVLGVLIMPPLLAILWIGVFGGAALHLELTQNAGLADAVDNNITSALFELFKLLPLTQIFSLLSILLIMIFLITSADSASYILAQMTHNGEADTPLFKRLTWGVLLAAITLTLIASGGLEGLQAAAILAALPFTFIIYAMVFVLFRELDRDRMKILRELQDLHGAPVAANQHEARKMSDAPGE